MKPLIKDPFEKNPKIGFYISLFALVAGGILSYFMIDTEPWSTIGGFICGFSVITLVTYIGKIKS